MKYLLGFDIGSSSIKATLLEIDSGKTIASAFSPPSEMPMQSSEPGFAEQDPDMWWKELVNAVNKLHQQVPFSGDEVADRKSTRLNSSHGYISYAVFCLKKKKQK